MTAVLAASNRCTAAASHCLLRLGQGGANNQREQRGGQDCTLRDAVKFFGVLLATTATYKLLNKGVTFIRISVPARMKACQEHVGVQ